MSGDPVRAALEAAHDALINAAIQMAGRYGPGSQQALQLNGAARMISDDWLPTMDAAALTNAAQEGGGDGQ